MDFHRSPQKRISAIVSHKSLYFKGFHEILRPCTIFLSLRFNLQNEQTQNLRLFSFRLFQIIYTGFKVVDTGFQVIDTLVQFDYAVAHFLQLINNNRT